MTESCTPTAQVSVQKLVSLLTAQGCALLVGISSLNYRVDMLEAKVPF